MIPAKLLIQEFHGSFLQKTAKQPRPSGRGFTVYNITDGRSTVSAASDHLRLESAVDSDNNAGNIIGSRTCKENNGSHKVRDLAPFAM